MRHEHWQGWKGCFALGVISLCVFALAAGPQPPKSPEVSKFAPADVVLAEVDELIQKTAKALEDEQTYQELSGQVARDASTLNALAQALAMHDQDHRAKKSAGTLVAATDKLAQADNFAAAKTALASVQAAAGGQGEPTKDMKWQHAAGLDLLMKQCTLSYNKLKRGTAGSRFKSRAADNARAAVVLAVIAQVVLHDSDYVEGDQQQAQWYQFCAEWRDAAGTLGTAIKQGNREAALDALAKLDQSCTKCHTAHKVDVK